MKNSTDMSKSSTVTMGRKDISSVDKNQTLEDKVPTSTDSLD